MKKSSLSTREFVMLVLLAALLIGVIYYLGFYVPLQREITSVHSQSAAVDTDIATATAKAVSMKNMQDELDEIFSRPKNEITEIAPYDNKEVVLNMLYGILARTQDYSLSFTDPDVEGDGTVRRNITMNFSCQTYDYAKAVIKDLTNSKWRCLVSNLSIAGETDMMDEPVTVSMTITFFESTKLN